MSRLTIRDATEQDLPYIVGLIDSDAVSAKRDPAMPADEADQREGFDAIAGDPNHRLLIAEVEGKPVGSFQLSYIPGVSRQGAWRGQIESVRVHPDHQSKGIGGAMLEWAVEECRKRGCGLVQLTSDTTREDAHRFYERLGFKPTHTGFKLKLR
ncbi:GNAT family N-acetyltransferase [Altererythrobacter lutimaris]|uniref:GNAT family N-acetyltransferase n=1 Tax=Altererythrobacter lutimaris TaxID=2743979 RepID=A0A850H9V9_9SPHN|nr:GNAT family N-acetyltransferase [Altererythrobacter lutimaris]NVE94260.1 GNAT family N-acetyltransferase [Altererythrobacter lutimaris]